MVPVPSGNSPVTRSPTAKRPFARTGFDNDAGRLDAHDRIFVGIETQGDHDVTEIGGDGGTSQHAPGRAPTARQRRGSAPSTRFSNVPPVLIPNRHGPSIRRHQHAVDRAAAMHPRGVNRARPAQHLRLTDRQGRRDRFGIQRPVGVDQHDPAGVLGLRRPHQPPHRRTRQIGDVLPRQRHRAPRRHHQEPRVTLGQPRPHDRPMPCAWPHTRRPPDRRRPIPTRRLRTTG